jgi:hypothetical protein
MIWELLSFFVERFFAIWNGHWIVRLVAPLVYLITWVACYRECYRELVDKYCDSYFDGPMQADAKREEWLNSLSMANRLVAIRVILASEQDVRRGDSEFLEHLHSLDRVWHIPHDVSTKVDRLISRIEHRNTGIPLIWQVLAPCSATIRASYAFVVLALVLWGYAEAFLGVVYILEQMDFFLPW